MAIVHAPFESHINDVLTPEARVLNVRCDAAPTQADAFVVQAFDEVVRAACADPGALWSLLRPADRAKQPLRDWPDALAEALRRDPCTSISSWARTARLDRATVSRGFVAHYGVTAARFRAEVRAHQAVRKLTEMPCRIVDIAADCGFADQAHLSRSVRALTGRTPSQVKSVQATKRGR